MVTVQTRDVDRARVVCGEVYFPASSAAWPSTGTPLLLLFGSGNRDETVFPDPDAVDLDRPNVRDHLAFGRGLHVCPGAPMARAEIRVALDSLLRRLPGLRLADGYEPTYIASYFFRGLESLDVTW